MQKERMKTVKDTSMLLCGLMLIFCQVTHTGAVNTYVAEVMIEGNATMDISGFVFEFIMDITTTVKIVDAELIGSCEIVDTEVTCWCENENIWSDLVCDTVSACCNVYKCVANVSDFTPMCVPKANVTLYGVILMSSISDPTTPLTTEFSKLNGYNGLTTLPITGGYTFKVSLNATFRVFKVQDIVTRMRASNIYITLMNVTAYGMTTMEIPPAKVCFNSQYILNCSTLETMETCMWKIAQSNQYPQPIGIGTEVLFFPCSNHTAINLLNITGSWSGKYTCLLTNGTVSHAADGQLLVALLPETINFTSTPPTADCSVNPSVTYSLNCSIYTSTQNYTVTINDLPPTSMSVSGKVVTYSLTRTVNCLTETSLGVVALCKIKNDLNQVQVANITIPVIHPGDPFCEANGTWPQTKSKEKAVILCDMPGRTGTMERWCNGSTWKPVDDLCTKAALNLLISTAGDFEKGIGATEEYAYTIFESLKNSTAASNSYGDVTATVNVLLTMSRASGRVSLGESLLPNFLESASSVLDTSWKSGDKKRDYSLASVYLVSVESLVKNIQINASVGQNCSNIQLQVCRNATSCNTTVFNVDVELNTTATLVKTMGIQNMATRLPKGEYETAVFASIIVSAVVENSTDPLNIRMLYPINPNDTAEGNTDPICIFWNVTNNVWSEDGCSLKKSNENMSYCVCNHLTSFSMLLSKTPVHLPFLDQLTYIGLGISICSLIVFILIECLVWKLVVKSSLSFCRHISLVNIAVSLLMADGAFVASSFPNILNDTLCLVLVFAKHFFFMAMFFWMLCLSIMLVRQLIFVFSQLSKKIFLIVSIITGYGCPLVIVIATYFSYSNSPDVKYHSRVSCWLTYVSGMKGSIYSFLFPVYIIVFVNLLSIGVVIATLLKPSGTESNKKDDKEAIKSILKVIVFLTPVFGGTWILGLFVFMMDDNKNLKVLLNYAFTIVNSLQGFFILLTGCFGEKRVRDEIVKLVNPVKGKSESKTTLTSAAK